MEPWVENASSLLRIYYLHGVTAAFHADHEALWLREHRLGMHPHDPGFAELHLCQAAMEEVHQVLEAGSRLVNDADRVHTLNYHFQAWSSVMEGLGPGRPKSPDMPTVVLEYMDNYLLYPNHLFHDPFRLARLEENFDRFQAPYFAVGPPRDRGMLLGMDLEIQGYFSVSRVRMAPPQSYRGRRPVSETK